MITTWPYSQYTYTNFLSRLWHKLGIFWHTTNNIQSDGLLTNRTLEIRIPNQRWNIIACFFHHLPRHNEWVISFKPNPMIKKSTSRIAQWSYSSSWLIFPRGKLHPDLELHPLTSTHLSRFSFNKMAPHTGIRNLYCMKSAYARSCWCAHCLRRGQCLKSKKKTRLRIVSSSSIIHHHNENDIKDIFLWKSLELKRLQVGLQETNKVFIKPVCLLDLETNTMWRLQLCFWYVDDETSVKGGENKGRWRSTLVASLLVVHPTQPPDKLPIVTLIDHLGFLQKMPLPVRWSAWAW